MKDCIKETLTSALLRTLEAEQSLSVSDGIKRVLQLAPNIDLLSHDSTAVEKSLVEIGRNFQQRGVINPYWLDKTHKLCFNYYLVHAHPGWLSQLVKQFNAIEAGISHYILYGVWDSLIVLCGTENEADELLKRIQSTTSYNHAHFSARSILLFNRYKTIPLSGPIESHKPDLINQLVQKYDATDIESKRKEMKRTNVFLGPSWVLNSSPLPRVSAFVGISLRGGGYELSPDAVLGELLKDDSLKECLVHFLEVDKGNPFHYFAKLVCRDMKELDKATDAISFTKIGRVGLEGNTFIIASEREEFPILRAQKMTNIGVPPDIRHIETIANTMIAELEPDAINAFNILEGHEQLIILRSLDELNREANNRAWDDGVEDNISSAIDDFTHSILKNTKNPQLTGAVMKIAASVEGRVKHVLRRIVETVYGHEYSLAQKELKLPTSDFRLISMGKAVFAFRTIKEHKDFEFFKSVLEVDWIDRLERFSTLRNTWAHAGTSPTLTSEKIIDEARHVLVEGIELIRWLGENVIPKVNEVPTALSKTPEITLPERRGERKLGIFLSHATVDKTIAERIAIGLKALGCSVWYDSWAIKPGESIVQKINDELAKNDTLVILLSPNSVASKWVQRELNTTLMKQLSGQKVTIIPVLIEKCQIPAALQDIKYIDMVAHDFQAAFIELLEALRR